MGIDSSLRPIRAVELVSKLVRCGLAIVHRRLESLDLHGVGFYPCCEVWMSTLCLAGGGNDLHDELLHQNSGAAEALDDLAASDNIDGSRQTSSSQASSVRGDSIAPEYSHLPADIATHLTRLKVFVPSTLYAIGMRVLL